MIQQYFEDPNTQKLILIFARLTGLIAFVPPFMNNKISVQIKGGFIMILTIALSGIVKSADVAIPMNFPEMGLAVAFELLIGFIIGFSVQILFTSFQLAGEFVDRHIGFAMASLVDPQTDITVSILGSLLMNLGLFLFIDLGGHNWVLETFAGSFRTIPLLSMNVNEAGILYHMSELFVKALTFAAEFSIPVIIFVTLIYVIQGFMQRTIPQLQIFVVGFIFTITAGIFSIRLLMEQFIPASEGIIEYFQQRVWFIISHLDG